MHCQAERLFRHGRRGSPREASGRPRAGRFPGGPAALGRRLRAARRWFRLVLGRFLGCAHAPLGAVLSAATGGTVLIGVVVVDGRIVALVRDEECPRHGVRERHAPGVPLLETTVLESPRSLERQLTRSHTSSGPRRRLKQSRSPLDGVGTH